MRSRLFSEMTLHDAMRLNQEGVVCLTEHHTAQALKLFHKALDLLYEIEVTLSPPSSPRPKTRRENLPHIWSSVTIPDLSFWDDERSSQDLLYVYNHAMIVRPQHHQDDSDNFTQNQLHFYNAAILFNMGLAFSLRGKQQGSNPDRNNTKAAQCYTQCLEYLENITTTAKTACWGDIDMMKVLALNNQCQLICQLGDLSRVRLLLAELQTHILSPTVLLGCQHHCSHRHHHQNDRQQNSSCHHHSASVFHKQQCVIGELMLNVLVSWATQCGTAGIGAAAA